MNHVKRGVLVGETPKPVRFPVDAPAGFVRMQDGAFQHFIDQLLAPRLQPVGQTLPHAEQSSPRDAGVQMTAQEIDDLLGGHPQSVVPMGGQGQRPISQSRVGQRVFDFGLHQFFAVRAITAGNFMRGDLRFDIRRNVFDHAGSFGFLALARSDGATAIRASFQRRVLDGLGDLGIFLAPASGMAGFSPALPVLFRWGGFLVGGNYPGRGAGFLGLLGRQKLLQAESLFEDEKHRRLRVFLDEGANRLLVEFPDTLQDFP